MGLGGWPIQVQDLWLSAARRAVGVGQPLAWRCPEAAVYRTLRLGRAGLSPALPACLRGQHGREAIPAPESLLRLCRAVAPAFTGALKCDETTFGSTRHGPRGRGALGKLIVFGIIKRNGEVKAMPIETHDRKAVMQQIDARTREARCTTPTNGRLTPR